MHTQVTTLLERTDDELSAMLEAGDIDLPTVEAVCAAQDQAAERATKRAVAYTSHPWAQSDGEHEAAAYAQYQQAEEYSRGNMLSDAGKRKGRDPWPMLWEGSQETAYRLASDELVTFWDYVSPRVPGAREFRDTRHAQAKAAHEQATEATVTPGTQPRTQGQIREDVQAAWKRNHEKIRAEHEAAIAANGGAVAKRDSGTVTVGRREPIDGAALLTKVRKFLTRYCCFPSESAATAVALWVAASHCRDEDGTLIWGEFPILGFLSDEPGSGKTRALELLAMLCPNTGGILTEPSEAAVALLVGKHHRTILLDEGDILFGAGQRKAAIRAILNSGYKRGGTWDRVRKGDVESVPTYGAKAIAALSVAKTGTGSTLDALFSRMVEITMRRAAGVVVHKPREVVGEHAGQPVTGEHVAARLAELLADWAAQERAVLAAAVPSVPDGVELRNEELWAAMLAVGERAGGGWQEMTWDACVDLSLYGGTPDVTEDTMDMIDNITSDW